MSCCTQTILPEQSRATHKEKVKQEKRHYAKPSFSHDRKAAGCTSSCKVQSDPTCLLLVLTDSLSSPTSICRSTPPLAQTPQLSHLHILTDARLAPHAALDAGSQTCKRGSARPSKGTEEQAHCYNRALGPKQRGVQECCEATGREGWGGKGICKGVR